MTAGWRPTASFEALRLRARVIAALRSRLEGLGSLEVETPLVVPSPGVDAHLDAPTVSFDGHDGFLHTSPEYSMKRLLAAGSGPIHQLGPAFRAGERGRMHEPQFTMLEWYGPGDDETCMDTTEDLIRAAAAEGDGWLHHDGEKADARLDGPAFVRRTFRDVFEDATGCEALNPDPARLGRLLRVAGVKPPGDCSTEELVDLTLSFVVQPELGLDVPVFVTDWPVDRAALARVRPGRDADGAPAAARFELYACGVELCNGYHELADPVEQRLRITKENLRRGALDKAPYPIDERFLEALAAGLPDCAGNALGVDRLVMLVGSLPTLLEARAFPVECGASWGPLRN